MKPPIVAVGHRVTLRFKNDHPEVTGIVEFISDEHITVAYGVTTKRFKLADVVHIGIDL